MSNAFTIEVGSTGFTTPQPTSPTTPLSRPCVPPSPTSPSPATARSSEPSSPSRRRRSQNGLPPAGLPLSQGVAMAIARQQSHCYGDRPLFSRTTQAFLYTVQAQHPLQRMLDFDYLCKRETPSVAGIILPNAKAQCQKAFYGSTEIKVPVYRNIAEAVSAVPGADVLINYSPQSSAFQSSLVALNTKTIRTVVITTEGVPENQVRKLIAAAARNGKVVIGPGTVGGIQAGAFKVGDTSGTAENVLMCKLYRPGSVGVVCKSSGLMNELCFMLARYADGLYEGIVVGADQYVCSTMLEHVLRMQAVDAVKMIVVVGEPGGHEEYDIAEAYRFGAIRKPIISWVLGHCGDSRVHVNLRYGRESTSRMDPSESAQAKNAALRDAGIVMPESFEGLGPAIEKMYKELVESGELIPAPDSPAQFMVHHHRRGGGGGGSSSSSSSRRSSRPSTPSLNSSTDPQSNGNNSGSRSFHDSSNNSINSNSSSSHLKSILQASQTQQEQQQVLRQPQTPRGAAAAAAAQRGSKGYSAAAVANATDTDGGCSSPAQPRGYVQPGFVSCSISSPGNASGGGGGGPIYSGIPAAQLVEEKAGVGDVISLLWFKRRLPRWASRFLEVVVVMLADKGPCDCAAHSSIVASRAGRDVVSALCAGLLSMSPLCGAGADDAARCWFAGMESKLSPQKFVERMKRDGIVIRGIGSSSPKTEKRAAVLRQYALGSFPSTRYLEFAHGVEKVTSLKAKSLILNLDGILGVLFLDMMDGCSEFTREEMVGYVDCGCLSSLLAFARSIGLIGHAMDQKRLKQPPYVHPVEETIFC